MSRRVANSDPPWDEAEYLFNLQLERQMFAWCLMEYGNIDDAKAKALAEVRYPFEPPEKPYRGAVFHDSSWHWAMIELHGQNYWIANPALEKEPDDYVQRLQQVSKTLDTNPT